MSKADVLLQVVMINIQRKILEHLAIMHKIGEVLGWRKIAVGEHLFRRINDR